MVEPNEVDIEDDDEEENDDLEVPEQGDHAKFILCIILFLIVAHLKYGNKGEKDVEIETVQTLGEIQGNEQSLKHQQLSPPFTRSIVRLIAAHGSAEPIDGGGCLRMWMIDKSNSVRPMDAMTLENGAALHVKKTGFYDLRLQIIFLDVMGSWACAAVRTSRDKQREELARCQGMQPHIYRDQHTQKIYPVVFQCSTSRVAKLNEGDVVVVENLYGPEWGNIMKLGPYETFFEVIQLE